MTYDRTDRTTTDVRDEPLDVRDEPVTTVNEHVVRRGPPMYGTRWSGIYRDRVSWGAIWGGLLTALGLFLLLSLLATAIGITTVQQGNVDPENVGRVAGVVSAVLGLLAFFVGGFIAGRGGGIVGQDAGAVNGFLVWALALVVVLVLTALGVGQLFGTLGGFDVFRQLRDANVDPSQAGQGVQTAAWITFISMALAATAATLGGWLGAVSEEAAVA